MVQLNLKLTFTYIRATQEFLEKFLMPLASFTQENH